ncbi:unnamed protein product [Gordionus sp. m RMFG-2023]|uniref:uncharacterized protein LOC135924731 n=1 Tax=Gordionus sp. m RMFG-2023 TaxID=3053472 RepID=UPI0030E1AA21
MASNEDSLPGFPKKSNKQIIKTMENIVVNYVPMIGAAGYFAFLSNVMNPNLLNHVSPEYKLALANSLLFTSNMGIGLYLYNSKHLALCQKPAERIAYTLLGTVMFNFGSILLCATSRVVMPEEPYTRFIAGAILGAGFLYFGRKYVLYLDNSKDF